ALTRGSRATGIRPRPPETALYWRSLAHYWRTTGAQRRLDSPMQVAKDASTDLRVSSRRWWGKRLFVLGWFALGVGLSAAFGGGAARADAMQHVWVHYDYMVAADGTSYAPDPRGIALVVQAFAAHGIDLHVDSQHTAIPNPDNDVVAF